MESIETLILKGLVFDEEYTRAIIPFLNEDLFDSSDKIIFRTINDYVEKYNNLPTADSLAISLSKEDIPEALFENIEAFIDIVTNTEPKDLPNRQWLIDETESYCSSKMLFSAVNDAIEIVQGNETDATLGDISRRIEEANAFCFDNRVGHSYFGDAEEAWIQYTSEESRLPFEEDILNKVTRGGTPNKTLNIILADTNVGKSLCLCSFASSWVRMGKNVLYISMEMSEEQVRERIDANLLDVDINTLVEKMVDKDTFCSRVRDIQTKGYGDLYVKQFPTGAAHVGHFRHLIRELKTKQKFIPDVICIDYLNICTSQRATGNAIQQSYGYVKTIAEEVRGLAIENDLPIWSATQSNRNGSGNVDLSLTDTSESYGVPQTADCMWGVVQDDNLAKLDQFLWIQLKSRYSKKQDIKNWITAVDYSRMRIVEHTKSHATILQENLGNNLPKVEEKPDDDDPFSGVGNTNSNVNFDTFK